MFMPNTPDMIWPGLVSETRGDRPVLTKPKGGGFHIKVGALRAYTHQFRGATFAKSKETSEIKLIVAFSKAPLDVTSSATIENISFDKTAATELLRQLQDALG